MSSQRCSRHDKHGRSSKSVKTKDYDFKIDLPPISETVGELTRTVSKLQKRINELEHLVTQYRNVVQEMASRLDVVQHSVEADEQLYHYLMKQRAHLLA